jgi:adenylate kinase|tara:strand:+ start:168 stop:800 length:633 start_codon:yes stop_codon:yes gene_type:complete
MNLILLGMPGAGKGTQADLIKNKFHIPTISTGAILREVSNSNSPLAKKVRGFLDAGTLVPDEIIVEMLVQRVEEDDCKDGFILDGFPRNLDQAKALENAGIAISNVIFLKISESEIISRMSGRRVHLPSGRSYHIVHNPPKNEGRDDETGEELVLRDDDKPEVIKKRLEVYFQETEPLLDFYINSEIIFDEVDAAKSVEDVTNEIFKILT